MSGIKDSNYWITKQVKSMTVPVSKHTHLSSALTEYNKLKKVKGVRYTITDQAHKDFLMSLNQWGG